MIIEDSDAQNQPSDLISQLGDVNGLVRQRARLMLIHLGEESLPYLRDALESLNPHVRLEAVKALGEFPQPESATLLAEMLMDHEVGVRWSAAESLIQHGRASLRPILQKFVKDFDSTVMREGLRHILHVFRDRKMLNQEELLLFEKLSQQDIPGLLSSWTGEAGWAAEKALEALDRE